MHLARRHLLAGLVPAAAAAGALPSVRADFPLAEKQVYLNSAGVHPLSIRVQKAGERYLAAQTFGTPHSDESGDAPIDEAKTLFAKLAGAKPSEIAIVQSTLSGENVVAAGLGLHDGKGNIVTDELHYHGGLYVYRSLERAGLQVRVVKQKDWRIPIAAVDAAVDRHTRLVAMTLVSNINGFIHDAKAVSEIAHARGAYVYADIVQTAGCVPLALRASGIDFASASTYKWLMGLRGFGFLYVREELHEKVLRRTHYGERQYSNFEYHNFPGSAPGPAPYTWKPGSGARMYEVGNVSAIGAVCAAEALRYIHELGVGRMQAHTLALTKRLRKEVPRFGFPNIAPDESTAPMAAFLVEKPEPLRAKLTRANVAVKIKWNQMRVSPSVFNTDGDVDRFLNALS